MRSCGGLGCEGDKWEWVQKLRGSHAEATARPRGGIEGRGEIGEVVAGKESGESLPK